MFNADSQCVHMTQQSIETSAHVQKTKHCKNSQQPHKTGCKTE